MFGSVLDPVTTYTRGQLEDLAKAAVKGKGRLVGWALRIREAHGVFLVATWRNPSTGEEGTANVAL
jgi:hypothetical protein